MQLAKFTDIDRLWLTDSSAPPRPGTIVPCLVCGKPMLMPYYSGTPDQVCPECFDTYRECARLVCSVCNVVVARVKPGITDTGFYVRPRASLHIDNCAVCRPGIVTSVIFELDAWYRQIGKNRKLILPAGVKAPEEPNTAKEVIV